LKKIVTFGEVLLRLSKPDDLRLAQGRTFNGNYGGSEANAAVSLATLGNQVEYVSRIPDNAIGRACAMRLREYGLRLNHVVWGGERLGTYYFEGSAAMRNSHVVYDRSGSSFYTMAPGMIDWRTVFQDAAIFHCSGITCALSASAAAATMEGVRIAEEMGVTIACDINYRKNLWHYGADAHETLKELASHADIIFGDQGEYEVVTGLPRVPFNATDSQAVIDRKAFSHYLRAVHEQLPKCKKMVLACRNQLTSSHHTLTGMLLSSDDTLPSGTPSLFTTRIYDINPVIDPMGVGDAFMAAFLHAYSHWGDDNQRCLDFSLAASALKNSVTGDFNLVTESEIESVMNDDCSHDDLRELQ